MLVPVGLLRDMPPEGLQHAESLKALSSDENCGTPPSSAEAKGTPRARRLAHCPRGPVGALAVANSPTASVGIGRVDSEPREGWQGGAG